ncbi:MAG: hypothetical protein UZ22_OP11002000935, partial [Microgenomates bacterium OLB23]
AETLRELLDGGHGLGRRCGRLEHRSSGRAALTHKWRQQRTTTFSDPGVMPRGRIYLCSLLASPFSELFNNPALLCSYVFLRTKRNDIPTEQLAAAQKDLLCILKECGHLYITQNNQPVAIMLDMKTFKKLHRYAQERISDSLNRYYEY